MGSTLSYYRLPEDGAGGNYELRGQLDLLDLDRVEPETPLTASDPAFERVQALQSEVERCRAALSVLFESGPWTALRVAHVQEVVRQLLAAKTLDPMLGSAQYRYSHSFPGVDDYSDARSQFRVHLRSSARVFELQVRVLDICF